MQKKFKDRIEIVSDSQTTTWYFSYNSFDWKIIKYWEKCYIWFSWLLTDVKKFKKLFTNWVLSNIKTLKEFDELIDWFVWEKLDIHFIAVIKDKIYCFQFYENWKYDSFEVKDFVAVGSWTDLATMWYEFTDNLIKIVENVIKHDTGCWWKIVKKIIKM